MIVKTDSGEVFVTRRRSVVTFRKVLKRWYLVLQEKGVKSERLIAVKHVASVKGGEKV